MKEEKRYSQVAGVSNKNALRNVLLTDIFISFIKIYGLSPAPHKINATSKQHLSRQVLQVSRRIIFRKEILNTFESVLKCCGGQISE